MSDEGRGIFVIRSFMVKDGEWKESGKLFYFFRELAAVEYMLFSGRPGPNGGYYDDPFELRWNYAVIEEVFEGPMSVNRVHSWWKANFNKNGSTTARRLKRAPFKGANRQFNFTGIG